MKIGLTEARIQVRKACFYFPIVSLYIFFFYLHVTIAIALSLM